MTNTDVIRKLIGQTMPYGDSNIDKERFTNLKEKCSVVVDLLEDIADVSQYRSRPESSIKIMADWACKCLKDIFDELKIQYEDE